MRISNFVAAALVACQTSAFAVPQHDDVLLVEREEYDFVEKSFAERAYEVASELYKRKGGGGGGGKGGGSSSSGSSSSSSSSSSAGKGGSSGYVSSSASSGKGGSSGHSPAYTGGESGGGVGASRGNPGEDGLGALWRWMGGSSTSPKVGTANSDTKKGAPGGAMIAGGTESAAGVNQASLRSSSSRMQPPDFTVMIASFLIITIFVGSQSGGVFNII